MVIDYEYHQIVSVFIANNYVVDPCSYHIVIPWLCSGLLCSSFKVIIALQGLSYDK